MPKLLVLCEDWEPRHRPGPHFPRGRRQMTARQHGNGGARRGGLKLDAAASLLAGCAYCLSARGRPSEVGDWARRPQRQARNARRRDYGGKQQENRRSAPTAGRMGSDGEGGGRPAATCETCGRGGLWELRCHLDPRGRGIDDAARGASQRRREGPRGERHWRSWRWARCVFAARPCRRVCDGEGWWVDWRGGKSRASEVWGGAGRACRYGGSSPGLGGKRASGRGGGRNSRAAARHQVLPSPNPSSRRSFPSITAAASISTMQGGRRGLMILPSIGGGQAPLAHTVTECLVAPSSARRAHPWALFPHRSAWSALAAEGGCRDTTGARPACFRSVAQAPGVSGP
jgi:hypothetical protein